MRNARIVRKTNETDIALDLSLEGGACDISTGCGFLDHMLTLLARHAGFGLSLRCAGDTRVDYHHSAEDIGICIGSALRSALGEKRGIARYGDIILPMDEALALCAVDISGRGGLYWDARFPTEKIGDFDAELVREFMCAMAREAGITLHLRLISGENSHHIAEALFKALARALAKAVKLGAGDEIPSTKGVL